MHVTRNEDYDVFDPENEARTLTRKEGETRGRKPMLWEPCALHYRETKRLAAMACPASVIAITCGVAPAVFLRTLKRNEKLQEAFLTGRASGELKLVTKLWDTANDHGPRAFEALKFLLTHQFGWASKQIVEQAATKAIGKVNHKVVKVDPSERQEFERQRGIDDAA